MTASNAYKIHRNLTTTGATSETTGILEFWAGVHRGGGVLLTGTFTGTVEFEESIDGGTTWGAKTVYPAAGGAGVTSATAVGSWKFALGGSALMRVRCSAFTSGPISVDVALTKGVDPIAALQGGSGVAPVGGGIVWQAPVAVAMTGSSKVFVPATAGMKALQMWSPAANAAGGIDLAAGTVVLLTAVQLTPGAAPIYIEGAACPVLGVTAIGTNLQNFYYQIGL